MAVALSVILVAPAQGQSATQVQPGDWTVSLNGNESNSVALFPESVALLATPITAQRDFPYVVTAHDPFPAEGDFTLTFSVHYTALADNGVALAVLSDDNRVVFWVWADMFHDESAGLFGQVGKASATAFTVAGAGDTHNYGLRLTGREFSVSVDGRQRTSAPSDLRPTRIWIGHPSLGQVLGLNQDGSRPSDYKLDSQGRVTGRWWGGGSHVWSALVVDGLSVGRPSGHSSAVGGVGPTLALLCLAATIWRRGAIRIP